MVTLLTPAKTRDRYEDRTRSDHRVTQNKNSLMENKIMGLEN